MSIKLEVGKQYVRRNNTVTGKLVLNKRKDVTYPYRDTATGFTYTPEGRYDVTLANDISMFDLVEEYVEQVSTEESTPKQDTLPAEPVPGKYYRSRGGDKLQYVGKAENKWVYHLANCSHSGSLSCYPTPFSYHTTIVSAGDIIAEWKESVTLPFSEVFKNELRSLINKYGIDTKIGVPDFLVESHLVTVLDSLRLTLKLKRQWDGIPIEEEEG